jgi:hypothetical protein
LVEGKLSGYSKFPGPEITTILFSLDMLYTPNEPGGLPAKAGAIAMSGATSDPRSSSPASPASTTEPLWAKPGLGIFSLALFGAGLALSWWYNKEQAFNLMIGAVISNATTVVGYYFGSSSGSANKTAILAARSQPSAPIGSPQPVPAE